MKTLIAIIGPTGIGKTDLSINIAKKLSTEILSCDSRQVYKELKIGTAVPSESQLQKVTHHFVGHKSIHDYYNASMFEIEALEILEILFRKYNQVIMTGGSGLYINAVCHGIDDLPGVDQELRKELLQRLQNEGVESLRMQLKLIDPEYYKQADTRNPKRILKALEVTLQTGKPYSSFLTNSKKERNFSIIKIGLQRDRDELYERINQRVDQMISEGLLEEAKSFYPFKYLNSLNTVGYKELFDYFDGNISLEKAIELIKRNSRHYAKRQISWFGRDKGIHWFHPDDEDRIVEFINKSH
ncbi:MAG: tRNA (adenosine(37)-N6)-dimethylallyltransferase MiaA [Bacteroidales bacterium]